ncbi:MAG: hypothetical protein V3V98_05250 [Thermoplasmata archaeon]
MTEDRGRLLFDESQHLLFRRRSIGRFIGMVFITSILIVGLVLGIWINLTASPNLMLLVVLWGTVLCFLPYSLWGYWRLGLLPVRIYENGIEFPPKTYKELKRGGTFVPFHDVDKVYVSEYTAFELRNGGTEYIHNEELYGFGDFISVLRERVDIEKHAGWTLGIGVIWEKPDRFEVHELELEMSWGDVQKQVVFDDLVGLGMGIGATIFHFRDGSRLAVDLDEDMSRQLTDAWRTYEERFWRDPEAEEERWEELESEKVRREEK